jgi:hypothetical protein
MGIENKQLISKQEAIVRIRFIMQKIFTGGNVDYEKETFEEILRKVEEGEIPPYQGIEEAEAIENRRNER